MPPDARTFARGRPTRWATAAVIAVLAVVLASFTIAPKTAPDAGVGAGRTGPFPRTAAVILVQERENLPTAAELSRYDLAVIDNEWSHRVDRSYFDEIRQRNPDIALLAYVNLVDHPRGLGPESDWANRFALWQFSDPATSNFPEEWLARSSDGTVLSQWPEMDMTNLTDRAPRVDGQTFGEYATDWVAGTVWASGVWDGIFLDVWGDQIFGASRDSWDIDQNGTDEPDSTIYGPGNPWERGVSETERLIRSRIPDAVLIANSVRTLRDQQLDGRVWEDFADTSPARDASTDLQSYVDVTTSPGHRAPGVALTITDHIAGAGGQPDFRRVRFVFTATLLEDGYWAPTSDNYGSLVYFDELDGGGLGPHYLGLSLASGPSWARLQEPFHDGVGTVADRLYRRDFVNGIVLHNASAQPRTVTLDGQFRRLRGSQDPVTNNGELVESVTVPGHDGVVLLRADQ